MNNLNHSEKLNNDAINNGYEKIKHQNRRRLMGAGIGALVLIGLFMAISGNTPKDNSLSENELTASAPVVQPTGLSHDLTVTEAPSSASNNLNADEMAADTHTVVDKANQTEMASDTVTASNTKDAETETAQIAAKQHESQQQLLAMVTPAPLEQVNATADDHHTGLSTAERRRIKREAQKAEREKRRAEAKLKREEAERARIAKAKADEIRRQKAQVIADKAEAERAARRQTAAEQARQAQIAAENTRHAERAKVLAEQQRKANKNNIQAAKNYETLPEKNIASNGKKIIVQAGAYRDHSTATKIQQKLRDMNLSAQVSEIRTAKGKMYRVQIGAFATREAAQNASRKISAGGINSMIIEQK